MRIRFGLFAVLVPFSVVLGVGPTSSGTLELAVHDSSDSKMLPCRVHLVDAKGKPQRVDGLPFWRDHFVCNGKARVPLPAGRYTFTVERGPEYRPAAGTVEISSGKSRKLSIRLKRITHLAKEGWWSGELHVHRTPKDVPLLMRAEDLHVAPVITWWNKRNLWKGRAFPKKILVKLDKNRFYHLMSGEDERAGGALLYFNMKRPLAIADATREFPSPVVFALLAAMQQGVWIDIEKPFWWDVPIWLAMGFADSVGLANNHMCRSTMYESEAWGKPRDGKRMPPPKGNGYWTQQIYYHILNTGLRIPPSAGSASGVLPNPVGYNRAYVHVGKELSYDKWFAGLNAGRVFVTNGPLLRVKANDQWPGHLFKLAKGNSVTVDVSAKVASNDVIRAVEIVHNGKVVRSIPYETVVETQSLGKLTFNDSGWFLVRAITENKKTFRFASTGPFYVEEDGKRHISKASAQFFHNWVEARMKRIKLDNAEKRKQVLRFHDQALRYWAAKVKAANAP